MISALGSPKPANPLLLKTVAGRQLLSEEAYRDYKIVDRELYKWFQMSRVFLRSISLTDSGEFPHASDLRVMAELHKLVDVLIAISRHYLDEFKRHEIWIGKRAAN